MRGAIVVAVLAAGLVGCKARRDHQKELEDQERKLEETLAKLERELGIHDASPDEAVAPAPPTPTDPTAPMDPMDPGPPATADVDEPDEPAAPEVPCIDADAISSARITGGALRVCQEFDDVDGVECFTVSRAGAITKVDPPRPVEAVHAEAEDIVAEVCPPGRACVRVSPWLRDGELLKDARASADGGAAALVISDDSGVPTRLELWDLRKNVRTGSADIADLEAIAADNLTLEITKGAIVVLAYEPGDDGLARGALFGLDGRRRATLGNPGGILNWATTDRMVAVFVLGAEDLGLAIGHDLRTGKKIGSYPVTPLGDDYLDMDDAGGRSVVFIFDGEPARLDVVDLATRKKQSRTVPVCD